MSQGVVRIRCLPDGGLDQIESSDAVALPVFEDERPVRGLTGLVDWRLHSAVSRLLLSGRFEGALGDSCLMPASGYVPMNKVFLFGAGPLLDFSAQRFRQLVARMAEVMDGVQATQQVLPLWDLCRGVVGPADAVEVFLGAGISHSLQGGGSITLVGGGGWGRGVRDALRTRVERGWGGLPLEIR